MSKETLYNQSGGIRTAEEIRSLLKALGFKQSLKGFNHTVMAIQYLLIVNRSSTCRITNEIYPLIAFLEDPPCSVPSVERAIRSSIESAYDFLNPLWISLMGTKMIDRPTNKHFLFVAAEEIHYRLHQK